MLIYSTIQYNACLQYGSHGNVNRGTKITLLLFIYLAVTYSGKVVQVCNRYIYCLNPILQPKPYSAICFVMVSLHLLRSAFSHSSTFIRATSALISYDIHRVAVLLKLQECSTYFQRQAMRQSNSIRSKSSVEIWT